MNYQDALDYIDQISGAGIVPGLENIKMLCEKMGNPQKELSFIHIAGTNGKGSTLAYISTVLKEAGLRVGRYISPVIFEYREKIQVNEKSISKNALTEGLALIKEKCEEMVAEGYSQPTVFEVETALAFWYFHKKKCNIVVLETGMGGALDATNIIENTLVCVFTSIGMDHMQFLGDTKQKIATQKAGIIKEGCTVVCMQQETEVTEVIDKHAMEKGASFILSDVSKAVAVKYGVEKQEFSYGDYKKLKISLVGKFQIANACLAIDACECLKKKGFQISEKAIRDGLFNTVWDGRLTVLSKKPLFLADGAHNEDAAQKLADSIEFYFTNKRIIYIMGILKDKEYEKVIQLTHSYADHIITVTPPNNKRAMNSLDLANEIAKVHQKVTAVDSVEEAVEMSRLLAGEEDVILAFGSLSYLGRLMEIVRKTSGSRKDKRSGKASVRGDR